MKSRQRKSILIVHENARMRMALSLRLQRRGWDTHLAGDIPTFRSQVFFEQTDLIIMGPSLGGQEGRAVYDWMVTLGLNASIPVIFLSDQRKSLVQRPVRLGRTVSVYVSPLNSGVLINDIDEYMQVA